MKKYLPLLATVLIFGSFAAFANEEDDDGRPSEETSAYVPQSADARRFVGRTTFAQYLERLRGIDAVLQALGNGVSRNYPLNATWVRQLNEIYEMHRVAGPGTPLGTWLSEQDNDRYLNYLGYEDCKANWLAIIYYVNRSVGANKNRTLQAIDQLLRTK